MNLALLVIDMQNAFCRIGGTMERMGLQIDPLNEPIPYIRELLKSARRARVPAIFTRYVYRSDYSDGGILIDEILPQIKEEGGLREGTWDIEIIDDLRPVPGDIVIDKNRYSAFFNTGLDSFLREADVDTLIVTGVTTNMCVESTVRDAHYRDYRVFVVREATAEIDPKRHEAALATIDFGFGSVITVSDALAILEEMNTKTSQSASINEKRDTLLRSSLKRTETARRS